MSTANPTVRSLDNRVDDLEKEFREFMAEMKKAVTFFKWLRAFHAAIFLMAVGMLFLTL